MSNRGGIDSQIVDLLEADNQIIFTAVKAQFDTETLYLWTGKGNVEIDGQSYIGAGQFLGISGIDDTLELKSSGVSVQLAGMDTTVLNLALSEDYQNRKLEIYLGYLSGGTDIVAGKMTLFSGRMTSMTIKDDPSGAIISVEAENRLIDLTKPSNLRYTKESQQYIASGDTCFNRVAGLQDKEIIWGKSTSTGGTTGTSSGTNNGTGQTRRIRA